MRYIIQSEVETDGLDTIGDDVGTLYQMFQNLSASATWPRMKQETIPPGERDANWEHCSRALEQEITFVRRFTRNLLITRAR